MRDYLATDWPNIRNAGGYWPENLAGNIHILLCLYKYPFPNSEKGETERERERTGLDRGPPRCERTKEGEGEASGLGRDRGECPGGGPRRGEPKWPAHNSHPFQYH